ncbi:MAG: hypothetical protein R6T89_04345 [Candidatus Syntrophosphaera sp.]|jgi:hypothetical protein
MKQRILLCSLGLVLLLFSSSCIVHSSLIYFDEDTKGVPNLLSNPGFSPYSLDRDVALLGWTVHTEGIGEGKNPVFIDGREAYEGNTSLRIDASKNTVTLLSDAFQVRRYGGYYSRVLARSTQEKGPNITVRFLTFRENGSVYTKFKSKMRTGREWKKETISAGFLRPGVSFGRIQIEIPPFSEGSVWLDDAGCWEVHHFRID